MEKLKKYNLIINLEIAIAFFVSIFLAQSINLENAITSGIITILSIQMTKKQTLQIAGKRLAGYILMLVLVIITFNILGYNLLGFGLFVLVFALLNSRFNISIGLAPNVVMAGHFYAKQTTDLAFIYNETAVYLIGLACAIIVNIIIPYTRSTKEEKSGVDNHIKTLLLYLANMIDHSYLMEGKEYDYSTYVNRLDLYFAKVKDEAKQFEENLIEKIENNLFNSNVKDLEYINMRINQINLLERIYEESKNLNQKTSQAKQLADYIRNIEKDYDENNTVLTLLDHAANLMAEYRDNKLPENRKEFENRAILYAIMLDLKAFLYEKYNFINRTNYENKNYKFK